MGRDFEGGRGGDVMVGGEGESGLLVARGRLDGTSDLLRMAGGWWRSGEGIWESGGFDWVLRRGVILDGWLALGVVFRSSGTLITGILLQQILSFVQTMSCLKL